uniref:DDB1-and CUL4-associated factor 8 n=1 Tax=Lygus hesperus TaxID=30085 RepID=A0A0A9Z2F7_LYGHE
MSDDEVMDSGSDNNNDSREQNSSPSREEDSSSTVEDPPFTQRQSGLFRLFSGEGYVSPFLRDWDDSSESSQEGSTIETATKIELLATPKVLLKPKPKHNWFMLKEIINREYRSQHPPNRFTRRFYSSLHAVRRLELMYKLEQHTGCVNAINFNSSGTRLISGSDDKTVTVWDWSVGKCATQFNTGHSSNVFQCKYLPLSGDGHIVTCSRDGQVRLANRMSNGTYKCHTKLAQHTKACHKIATLPHSPHIILSAGEDAQVFSIDVREKVPIRLMHVRENKRKISLYSIHANPMTGNEFVVAGNDYYVRIFDRRHISGNGIAEIKFKPSHMSDDPFAVYVTCAVFNYNGTEVIGSYNDDDIYLFDCKHASNTDFVHKYEGHRNAETVKGVNFYGPKSEYVISGSDCGHVYIWDKNTEGIVQWMRGDEEGVINCLEPHPHIPVLATSGMDHDVKIWISSCETDPVMQDLDKCIKINQTNREGRGSRHVSLLNRWWRRLSTRSRTAPTEEAPILVALDPRRVDQFGLLDNSDSSSSSSSSSSTASSDF